jgi:hypothetical protein
MRRFYCVANGEYSVASEERVNISRANNNRVGLCSERTPGRQQALAGPAVSSISKSGAIDVDTLGDANRARESLPTTSLPECKKDHIETWTMANPHLDAQAIAVSLSCEMHRKS